VTGGDPTSISQGGAQASGHAHGHSGQSAERIHSIQLMRALAAGVVAIVHQAFAYADHIGTGLGLSQPDPQISQSAVALFFVVSGYIMVIASQGLFGTADGRRIFWTRRCARILPPYWLATIGLVGIYLLFGIAFDGGELARSVLLIPFRNAANGIWALPILWVGWTLFYEMVFYALFGLGITKGRIAAVLVASAGLVLLVGVGLFVPVHNTILFTLTRPVVLIFLAGMALALMRQSGIVLPAWLRLLALAGALVGMAMLPAPAVIGALDFTYVAWAGLPAIALGVALLGGPLRMPGFALVDRLGDISYALYLLHMPVAVFWSWAYQKAFHPEAPWMLLVSMVIATYIASYLAFICVERPMTHWLNARLAANKG